MRGGKLEFPEKKTCGQGNVTKISSCRVNTTSRWGIKQLGILLIVAGGNPQPPPLNDSLVWSKGENQQQNQPTYGVDTGFQPSGPRW